MGVACEGLNSLKPKLEERINRQDKSALDFLPCTCLQDIDPNQSPCKKFWN